MLSKEQIEEMQKGLKAIKEAVLELQRRNAALGLENAKLIAAFALKQGGEVFSEFDSEVVSIDDSGHGVLQGCPPMPLKIGQRVHVIITAPAAAPDFENMSKEEVEERLRSEGIDPDTLAKQTQEKLAEIQDRFRDHKPLDAGGEEEECRRADRYYRRGLTKGWNLGISGKNAEFDRVLAALTDQITAPKPLDVGEKPLDE